MKATALVGNHWCDPRARPERIAAAACEMTNIPTELLRTLITVVDLRSFTKAAHSLGMTQPAVSAQIKRLQVLLGGELLDKSAPGVALTSKGEAVVQHARRLLSVNDQIVDLATARPRSGVRLGVSDEMLGAILGSVLSVCRQTMPGSFDVLGSEDLFRDLRQGELDLAIALGETGAGPEARHRWTEPLVWVCAPGLAFNRAGPLPLVISSGSEEIARTATAALDRSGAEWEAACRLPGGVDCAPAVAAGLGIGVTLQRFVRDELATCEDPRLPALPEVTCGIYLREAAAEPRIGQLADAIADTLRPAISAPSTLPLDVEEPANQLQPED